MKGHCYGGGVQLALGADFRISTPDAQWSVLEAKWGLIPDMSGIRSLAEVVGMDTAKLLTMTGDTFSGEEATELGLATKLARRPDGRGRRRCARLKTRSPDAIAAAKRLFDGHVDQHAPHDLRPRARRAAALLLKPTRPRRSPARRPSGARRRSSPPASAERRPAHAERTRRVGGGGDRLPP